MPRPDATPLPQRDAFLQALGGWDAAHLERLLELRPELAAPPPADLVALVDRASSPRGVTAALVTLDRGAWQVLEAACLLGADVTLAGLATLLGAAEDVVAAPVRRLAERALLFERKAAWSLAPGVDAHPALRTPARLGAPAATLLRAVTAPELERVAKRLALARDGGKAGLVSRIAATLGDAQQLAAVLARAPQGASEALQRVAEHGPGIQLPYLPGALDERSPVGWLLNRALLVRRPDWYIAEVPREVALALRGGKAFAEFVPSSPPVRTAPADPEHVDAQATAASLRLVVDVGTLLDTWEERAPKLLKDGGVGIRDVRRCAQAIDRTERVAAVVIELAARAGLVGMDGDPEMGAPTPRADDWRAMPVAGRWEVLVDAWLRTPSHPSLAGETATNGKPIPPMLEHDAAHVAVARRRLVLTCMAGIERGDAPDLASFDAAVEWAMPQLWTQGPAMPVMLVNWAVTEAAMLGLAVNGSLSSIGRLVATDRLGDATAALTGHTPVLARTVVIQADLTAVASGELEAPVRAELELLADVESKGAATVYRFSEASVRRGFDAGRSAPDIEGFLIAHAPKGVPQALRYLIGDVGRRHGSLRVGDAVSYVRSDDPALLAEACRARKLATLQLRTIAPTVAVSTAPVAKVIEALRAAGFLPAAEDASGAVLGAHVARTRARRLAGPPLPAPGGADAAPVVELAKGLVGKVTAQQAGSRSIQGREAPTPLFAWAEHDEAGIDVDDDLDDEDVDDDLADDDFDAPFRKGGVDRERHAELERPRAIVRGPAEIVALLTLAEMEEWLVRLSYVNGKGQERQLTAAIIAVLPSQVEVEVLPSWDTRTLVLTRVQWARALTTAEEEAL
jgi:hypothetical protein